MREAVQQREDSRLRADRGADRFDRGGEIVGFAGKKDDIRGCRYLVMRDGTHPSAEIPKAAFDPQPMFLQAGLASFADEKGNVTAALDEPAAEIPADSAGAERNDFHATIIEAASAERFDDFLAHLLGVAKQHHRVVAEKELIVYAGIARSHRAFHEEHGLRLLNIEDRH